MNVGSAFAIGSHHTICQDYSLCGMTQHPYIVVSDGCSNSPQTDFGSRIISKIASEMLMSSTFDIDELLIESNEIRRILNLHLDSLDATLLTAQVIDDTYYVRMFGDGVLAKTKKNGDVEVTVINYISGAPNYPSYGLNLSRKKAYIEKFGLEKNISNFVIKNFFDIEITTMETTTADNSFCQSASIEDYVSISLMTDGVESFIKNVNTPTSKSTERVGVGSLLGHLLNFKDYEGKFVDRRLKKFAKDCKEFNFEHLDDLTLATIYLG